MIYIFCALYAEAACIIERYGLKKQNGGLKFDVFENPQNSLRLILTGSGALRAAAAVSSVCTRYGVNPDDRYINFGICAGTDETGTTVLVNKISDQTNGRTFYPDMLLKSGLEERSLVTVPVPADEDMLSGYDAHTVFDMEAAGICEAAGIYMGPHCMSFVKTVSDHGSKKLSAAELAGAVEKGSQRVFEYIDLAAAEASAAENHEMPGEIEAYTAGLAEDMHCSAAMYHSLRQLMCYAYLTGRDYRKTIQVFYDEGRLPAGNKNAGKKLLDELTERFI